MVSMLTAITWIDNVTDLSQIKISEKVLNSGGGGEITLQSFLGFLEQ